MCVCLTRLYRKIYVYIDQKMIKKVTRRKKIIKGNNTTFNEYSIGIAVSSKNSK